MEKFKHLQKVKEIYSRGENIIQYLKSIGDNGKNTIEDILISYDFQSGSYIKNFADNKEFQLNFSAAVAKSIDEIDNVESILEVGVGEATTLGTMVKKLKKRPPWILGFDISWSRLKFAQEFLKSFDLRKVNLFTANLFEIPLMDNAVDVVYTSQSIEPNGGREEQALEELYRITGKYLILIEPSYEFAGDEAKARMREHGYVTELYATAVKLGYKVVEHRPFEYSPKPLNPLGLMIIEKEGACSGDTGLVCPVSRTKLASYSDTLLYSKESFLAYPVIDGIPCLLKDNAILATHLLTDYNEYLAEHKIDTLI